MTKGQLLKQSLGLSKFKLAYIQKAFDINLPVYVITVDSRFDGLPITWSRIKKFKSTIIARTDNGDMEIKSAKLTPPIELEYFSKDIPTRALIIFRDIAGEFLLRDNLYEECKVLKDTLNS